MGLIEFIATLSGMHYVEGIEKNFGGQLDG